MNMHFVMAPTIGPYLLQVFRVENSIRYILNIHDEAGAVIKRKEYHGFYEIAKTIESLERRFGKATNMPPKNKTAETVNKVVIV